MTIDILPGAERGELPCQNVSDPDLFFSSRPEDQARAVRLCNTCPVSKLCENSAAQRGEIHGVWGRQVRGNTSRTLAPVERTCAAPGCTVTFTVPRLPSARIYCGSICGDRARRAATSTTPPQFDPRVCESTDCDVEYVPTQNTARYCSPRCAGREKKRRERARKKNAN